jgi:crotonobetainyl-CoA:carnitine CoA-transferase CaiB-like acyl-CoA transferase
MQPLEGVRVVALEQAVAAPLATRHLADLGADVVKIERPDGGDFARGYDHVVEGLSANFVWLNRGKRSIVLDLKNDADRATAERLALGADIFVQNLGPGVAERLGLGASDLRTQNPRLIHCSLSGYGETGPYRERKAYDLLIQGESGAETVSGTPEQPARLGISAVDISGGMYMLSALLAALYQREQSDEGRTLTIALFDTIAEWLGVPLQTTMHGGTFARSGLRHNYIAPYGPFRCRDGTLNIAVQNDREWARLAAALGRAELADDPRFLHNADRYAHRDELQALIEESLGAMTLAQAFALLEEAGVAYGELRDVATLHEHPQLEAAGRWMLTPAETAHGPKELRTLRPPWDTPASGWRTRSGAIPALGQHTAELLAEVERGDWG